MQESNEHADDIVNVPGVLGEHLQKIDELLAEQNVPIADRPLSALNQLLILGVIADSDGIPLTSDPTKVVQAEWFPQMMKWIAGWYRLQYGKVARTSSTELLKGFILLRKTPFLLQVPPYLLRPGQEEGTAWLHLIDHVLDEEDSLTWIHDLPQVPGASERHAWKADATAVAGELRFIQNRVVSLVSNGNDQLLALSASIIPHLEEAATMVTSHKPVEITRSYWELQMAAEAGFKSLLLQRTGAYPRIHDLSKLSGDVAKLDSSFSGAALSRFPHWKKAADMRYGIGKAPDWEICYLDYRSILMIVRECVARWNCAGMSDASFLLKKPIWI